MNFLRVLILVCTAVCTSGCLLVEMFEYHIVIDASGHHATSETTYYNVQSNNVGEQFDVDFEEMISSWKGDQYLKDRAKEGVRVTERKLAIERGILVGRQKATFTDESPAYRDFFTRDRMRISFLARDVDSILHSNGSLSNVGDSLVVTWPHATKDFRIAVKFKGGRNGASFVPRFRDYLKSH